MPQFMSYWHSCHGQGVKIYKQVARRDVSSFADGLVFSRFQLPFNTFISFRVKSSAYGWRGALLLGVTTHDPECFKNRDSADNTSAVRCSFLAPPTRDLWLHPLPTNLPDEVKLSLYLSYECQLEVYIDGILSDLHLSDLPVTWPLWLVLDLYGSTTEVEFLQNPSLYTLHETEHSKKDLDIVPSKHIRIFLIGPEQSGKSLFKSALINNCSGTLDEDEKEEQQLDISHVWASRNSSGAEWNYSTRRSQKTTSQQELLTTFAYNVYRDVSLVAQPATSGETERETFLKTAADKMQPFFSGSFLVMRRGSGCEDSSDLQAQIDAEDLLRGEMRDKLERLVAEIYDARAAGSSDKQVQHLQVSRRKSNSEYVQAYSANIYEFSGSQLPFLLHQVVLSSHAIYVLVLDISKQMDEVGKSEQPADSDSQRAAILESSSSEQIDSITRWWLNTIHTLVGRSFSDRIDESISLPRILLVGTHRNQVHLEPLTRDQVVNEIFESIKQELAKFQLDRYLYPDFVAVDLKEMSVDEPRVIAKVKSTIQRMAQEQRLLPMPVPVHWLLFEQSLERLRTRGIHFAELNQLHELARSQLGDHFGSRESFVDAIQFHHNRGNIVCFTGHFQTYPLPMGGAGNALAGGIISSGGIGEMEPVCESGVVILSPEWFFKNLYKLLRVVSQDTTGHVRNGVIPECLLDDIWDNSLQNKVIFTSFLNKLDIMCEFEPYVLTTIVDDGGASGSAEVASSTFAKVYFCPWFAQAVQEKNEQFDRGSPEQNGKSDSAHSGSCASQESGCKSETSRQSEGWHSEMLTFYATFVNMIPKGFYSRLIVRLARWSWTQGMARKPEMNANKAYISIDFDHQLVMGCSEDYNRLTFWLWKIMEDDVSDELCPSPNIAVRARHLIESEMEHLKNNYYRRAAYRLSVRCPCNLLCELHQTASCMREECIHFLPLADCLTKKIVDCDYRQVRTNFIQKFFPQATYSSSLNENSGLLSSSLVPIASQGGIVLEDQALGAVYEFVSGWESMFPLDPSWITESGKQLSNGTPGKDWIALAKRLGYSERDSNRFMEETQPSLALLKDWYETNGRTRYSVDVLISCLKMISRYDVIQAIECELEPESTAPPVFISYQSDSQETVLKLRRRLEMTGFPCWMDVGIMGAGDALYAKIYDGISRSRVLLCCLTPRFAASPMCAREVILADVLHKPILPIMLEPTPWPPPGPLAVILSSLFYVDLCNVGSHGGSGMFVDSETRFRDLIERISRYVTGFVDLPCILATRPMPGMPDLFSPQRVPSLGRTTSLRSLSQQLAGVAGAMTGLATTSGRAIGGGPAMGIGTGMSMTASSFNDRQSISTHRHQSHSQDSHVRDNDLGAGGAAAMSISSNGATSSGSGNGTLAYEEIVLDATDPVQQMNRVANCSVCVII